MKLSELHTGQTGIVVKIHGHGAFRKRLIEMGFVKGHAVKVILHAPLKDPIKYSILGYEISLRAAEAALIDVVKVDDAELAVVGNKIVSQLPPTRADGGSPLVRPPAAPHKRRSHRQPQLRQDHSFQRPQRSP